MNSLAVISLLMCLDDPSGYLYLDWLIGGQGRVGQHHEGLHLQHHLQVVHQELQEDAAKAQDRERLQGGLSRHQCCQAGKMSANVSVDCHESLEEVIDIVVSVEIRTITNLTMFFLFDLFGLVAYISNWY